MKFSLMTFPINNDLLKKRISVEAIFRAAKENGILHVDVLRIPEKMLPEYKRVMNSTGVSVYCYTTVISFFEKPEAYEKKLQQELSVAKELGASLMMIVPYYFVIDTRKAKKLGRDKVRELMVAGYTAAVKIGKKFDLQVCFETTPQDDICLSGTEDCRYVLEHVEGLKLVLDAANMLPHGDTTLEAYEALKEYIVYVHLKEVKLISRKKSLMDKEMTADGWEMVPSVHGTGVIPLRKLISRMEADKYDGVYAIEYVYPDVKKATYHDHVAQIGRFVNYWNQKKDGGREMVIGTQTFGLKDELNKDFDQTLRKVCDMGFQTVEPLILFQEAQGKKDKNLWSYETFRHAKDFLDANGVRVPQVHVGAGVGLFTMPAKTIVDNVKYLKENFGVTGFVFSGVFHSKMVAKKWGKLLHDVAREVTPYGCHILYHPHNDEFMKVSAAENALDIFFQYAGDDVYLQLDIGWAALAADELRIAKKYGRRIMSLHCKDFYEQGLTGQYTRKNMPVEAFAPIGEGKIKTRELVEFCQTLPNFNGTVIIDQDKSAGNMMEDLQKGYSNLAVYK